MGNTKDYIRIEIPGCPVTKKNHQRILKNHRTGRRFIAPSEQYTEYEEYAGWLIPKLGIEKKVNVRVLYYLNAKKKVDLVNLLECTCDILVKYGAIKDDSSAYIGSHDGSRVLFDKDRPRAEIYIEPFVERAYTPVFDGNWIVREGFYVCPNCGEAFHEKTNYCSNCGKELKDDDRTEPCNR